jgi:uncharacterized protein YdeI (YjbR/CyaY-like superfamily)
MVKTECFIQVEIKSTDELREWLQQNHTQKESVWLVLYKKSYGKYYISKQDIIDELLCFGWLDGMARKVNEDTYLLLVSPRRIEHWAESYKQRIKLLEAENRMSDAGIKAVEQSKQNGSWNYMDDVDALIKPQDFVKCLEEHPPAMANFDAFNASSKRNMLRYIKLAKTKETRAKNIELISTLAAQNKKLPGS